MPFPTIFIPNMKAQSTINVTKIVYLIHRTFCSQISSFQKLQPVKAVIRDTTQIVLIISSPPPGTFNSWVKYSSWNMQYMPNVVCQIIAQITLSHIPSIQPQGMKKSVTDIESSPWSSIAPSGVEFPILRACFPSEESIMWYRKMKNAKRMYAYGLQQGYSKASESKYKIPCPINTQINPVKVIRLGEIHLGRHVSTNHQHKGDRHLSQYTDKLFPWYLNVFKDSAPYSSQQLQHIIFGIFIKKKLLYFIIIILNLMVSC